MISNAYSLFSVSPHLICRPRPPTPECAVDTGYVTDPPKKLKFKKKSKVTELQLTKLKEDFNRFYPRIKDKITEYQDIAGDNPKYIEFKKILEAFVSKFKLLKVEPNFLKRYSEIEDKLTSLL